MSAFERTLKQHLVSYRIVFALLIGSNSSPTSDRQQTEVMDIESNGYLQSLY